MGALPKGKRDFVAVLQEERSMRYDNKKIALNEGVHGYRPGPNLS